MKSYYELIADLPRPTAEQTERFVVYVAGAHSWYKHLPAFPPGFPFIFYLDPNAGRQLIVNSNGDRYYRDRVKGDTPHHYTWMPTTEYLERFGCWNYSCDRPPHYLPPGIDLDAVDVETDAQILDPEGHWAPIPQEVIRVSRCFVTGLVHDIFNPSLWRIHQPAVSAFHEYAKAHADHADPQRLQPILRWMDVNAEAVAAQERRYQRKLMRTSLFRTLEFLSDPRLLEARPK